MNCYATWLLASLLVPEHGSQRRLITFNAAFGVIFNHQMRLTCAVIVHFEIAALGDKIKNGLSFLKIIQVNANEKNNSFLIGSFGIFDWLRTSEQ